MAEKRALETDGGISEVSTQKRRKGEHYDAMTYLNNDFYNDEFAAHFSKLLSGRSAFISTSPHEPCVVTSPFVCASLPNFFNPDFLESIREEMLKETYYAKNNDLYDFIQTADLKASKQPGITRLRDIFYGPLREWMQKVTGIELSDVVDMFAAQYHDTGRL
eukprot:Colp12_sorted_trinity150504_noHs@31550